MRLTEPLASPARGRGLGQRHGPSNGQGSFWPADGEPETALPSDGQHEPRPADDTAAAEPTEQGERCEGLVVRVVPDTTGVTRTFDYLVPEVWDTDGRAQRLRVGSIVRIDLGGQRLRGWVSQIGVQPPPGVKLRPLAKLTGLGPPGEVIDLAGWAAWRWAGHPVALLRAASPLRAVPTMPAAAARPAATTGGAHDDLFGRPGTVTVLRLPPGADPAQLAIAAAARGDALIVAPAVRRAQQLRQALRSGGVGAVDGTTGWARAAAGATVVGTRAAVWAPMPRLAAVLVIDEHDERLKNGRSPAWNARDVALERARRTDAAAVLVSPVPSLEALTAGTVRTLPRQAERDGWPVVYVLDRRNDDPVRGGLFAEGLREFFDGDQRVVAVLNRKGRSRLLACKACGELARNADNTQAMLLDDEGLATPDGTERRPNVCMQCGSAVLRNLRMGVTRAREDLAALVGEPVGELTAASETVPCERVVAGTEAALWRLDDAATVVFLDFDQELLAPRQRASEQALALIARAGTLTGGRDAGGRVVVQTRQPDHVVIRAALSADPTLVTEAEQTRRRALRLPPYAAQAQVSGAGAQQLADTVQAAAGAEVRVLGPHDGAYLLRSGNHETLLDLLARVERPALRCRVEVDPLRA